MRKGLTEKKQPTPEIKRLLKEEKWEQVYRRFIDRNYELTDEEEREYKNWLRQSVIK